jgi:hypothetical protein
VSPPKRFTDRQTAVFQGPIHLDQAAAKAARVREVKCSCPGSPWCRGVSSADWLTCNTACKACRPTPWQAPTRTPALTGEPEHLRG